METRDRFSRSLQARTPSTNRMLPKSWIDIPYSTRTTLFTKDIRWEASPFSLAIALRLNLWRNTKQQSFHLSYPYQLSSKPTLLSSRKTISFYTQAHCYWYKSEANCVWNRQTVTLWRLSRSKGQSHTLWRKSIFSPKCVKKTLQENKWYQNNWLWIALKKTNHPRCSKTCLKAVDQIG